MNLRPLAVAATCLIILSLAILPTWAATSPTKSVPLWPQWHRYAERGDVTFTVVDCAYMASTGDFSPGDLFSAAQQASEVWAHAFPKTQIHVTQRSCNDSTPPTFGDGQDEIYWGEILSSQKEYGLYRALYPSNAVMGEEDIKMDPYYVNQFASQLGTDRQTMLYNGFIHEMGHALGLADAYKQWSDCGWSVMLAICGGAKLIPQPKDIAALEQIYGSSQGPVPAPTSSKASVNLSRFDLNHDGLLEDNEFFAVMDQWLHGQLDDTVFFAAIDAWTAKKPIQGAGLSRPSTAHFAAITLYDLSGQPVASQGCRYANSHALTASLLSHNQLPAGIYIARQRDCQTGQVSTHVVASTR